MFSAPAQLWLRRSFCVLHAYCGLFHSSDSRRTLRTDAGRSPQRQRGLLAY